MVHSRDGAAVAMPALVELAEGPWLATGLSLPPDGDPGTLRAGQPVAVAFARPTVGECYPVFCLAYASALDSAGASAPAGDS